MTRYALPAALAGVALGLCACDIRDEQDQRLWDLSSEPADGALGVPRAGRFVVALDRRIEPRTATSAHVSLRSGNVYWKPSVRLWPATSELWIDVDPRFPLDADISYEIEVDGLVDLDGVEQPEPYRILFRTGIELGAAPEQPMADPAEAHALLRERCAIARCHGGAEPVARLDLSSPDAIARTAIGAVSQVPAGTTGAEGARGAVVFAGMPIIDAVAGVGQPGTSYMLYKVLGDPHVWGERMPKGAPPLTRAEADLLSAWIAAGAPPP